MLDEMKEIVVDEDSGYYVSKEGVLFDKDMNCLICVLAGKQIQEYRIPDVVTKIGEHAFDGCDSVVIYTHTGSYAERWAKEICVVTE